MKPTITFLDAATLGHVEAIKEIGSLGTYKQYELTTLNERIERIAHSEVVITNKVIIDKEVIDACPKLKLICIAATGMNNVDLEYAAQKGVEVANVSGYSTNSVAQTTFSLLLYLLNKTNYFDAYVKSGEYAQSPIFTHHGRSFYELEGKTFGIIGLGTIGNKVAAIAEAFGAHVIYYSTSGKNTNTEYQRVELSELLSKSDIVSIHCPLNQATHNLIGEEELQQMKPTAFLLNTGRGGIVNESDLAIAIDQGVIAGAGIDVLTQEPIAENNPLLRLGKKENLVITPHIAWISQEAREKLVEGVIMNIKSWLSRN